MYIKSRFVIFLIFFQMGKIFFLSLLLYHGSFPSLANIKLYIHPIYFHFKEFSQESIHYARFIK